MTRVVIRRPVARTMSRRSIVAYEERVDAKIAEMKERLMALDEERVQTLTKLEVWHEVKHMITQISPPLSAADVAEEKLDDLLVG